MNLNHFEFGSRKIKSHSPSESSCLNYQIWKVALIEIRAAAIFTMYSLKLLDCKQNTHLNFPTTISAIFSASDWDFAWKHLYCRDYQRVNYCAEKREEHIDAGKNHERGKAERFLDCQGQLEANLKKGNRQEIDADTTSSAHSICFKLAL